MAHHAKDGETQQSADAVVDNVRIYYYPRRDEFRITSVESQNRGDAGDIVTVEQSRICREDFLFTVVRTIDPDHARLRLLCPEIMPGGRRWGFQ